MDIVVDLEFSLVVDAVVLVIFAVFAFDSVVDIIEVVGSVAIETFVSKGESV